MKKSMKLFAGFALCALVVSSVNVNAGYNGKGCRNYCGNSCFHDGYAHHCNYYVDENNDGICDHCYRINNDVTTDNGVTTPLVNTTNNNGNTNGYYGHHHGYHHGNHYCH